MYDHDAETYYEPGCCSVGGIRTKPSLLPEFVELYAEYEGMALLWVYCQLVTRHQGYVYRLNKWRSTINRILRHAVAAPSYRKGWHLMRTGRSYGDCTNDDMRAGWRASLRVDRAMRSMGVR